MPLPLAAIAFEARPQLSAARVSEPPVVDGKLDDPGWAAAEASEAFLQKFPDEGRPATERTTIRVVYDDAAVYVGFDCEQTLARVVERLTRRGRLVESDWVSVAFGTRGDGKTAYEFLVNASGVRVDGLRYNDTEKTEDNDENWEAATRLTRQGWSAEIKIPLHLLRFAGGGEQVWALQARRYVSERQETDEWAFFPRSAGGEVSRYGKLVGLRGLVSGAPLEVRPFVLGKLERREPTSYLAGSGTRVGGGAGLDLKWHATNDATFDFSLNPDFAQVEADQVVLNLSNFETYFPEKRPFFKEGVDVFTTPVQLLYTRRVGAAPPSPTLRSDERPVDPPAARSIWGASKLTGRLADGWSIGTLQALTAGSEVDVQVLDGSRTPRQIVPTTSYQVLRLRRDIGNGASLGVLGTSTIYAESSDAYPVVPEPADHEGEGPYQVCPNAVDPIHPIRSLSPGSRAGPLLKVPPRSRCFSDAYTGGLDGRWRSSGGDWLVTGQVAASALRNGAPRHLADGNLIRSGDVGLAAAASLAKQGGAHWVGDLRGDYLGKAFEANDLGFQPRGNLVKTRANLEYRELERHGPFLETHTQLSFQRQVNLDRLDLGATYQLAFWGKLANKWNFWSGVHYHHRRYDDREVGDGTALERAGHFSEEVWFESDRTKAVSFDSWHLAEFLSNGSNFVTEAGVLVRLFPSLDLAVLPTASYTRGEPRFAALGLPGEYVFGKLEAKSIGATLRATYTFTPRVTLQAYAQLLLASGHFTEFTSYASDPAGARPVVRLNELRPFTGALPGNPDFLDGVLNLNVVFRWEYRLGSTAYLVYTRSQSPDITLGANEPATLRFSAASRAPAIDVLLLKLSYWWG